MLIFIEAFLKIERIKVATAFDLAVARRWSVLVIDEPDVDPTIEIVEGSTKLFNKALMRLASLAETTAEFGAKNNLDEFIVAAVVCDAHSKAS